MTEPKTASEYLDRGCDKDDKKDSKGAIKDYNKAIELNPNYAEAYANRGCAKEELGDKEGAISDWQKAADLGDEEAAKWIKEVESKQVKNEPKISATTQNKIQDWALKGNDLVDAINNLDDKKEEFPIQVGYFYEAANGEKVILVEQFNAAVKQAKESDKRDGENSYDYDQKYYHIIKGRLCFIDPQHGGKIYISKKLAMEKYSDQGLEDFDVEYLMEENGWDEEDAKEEFEVYEFTEPMVFLQMSPMLYADTTEYERMSDKDLFEFEGIDIKDIHPESSWGDG